MNKYIKKVISLVLTTTKKQEKKEQIKKMNQVRLTSSTPFTLYQFINLLVSLMCLSLEMRFAHLKPHDVRFMPRFARHGSHHMAFLFISIGIFVHYIYHMFVSFQGSGNPHVYWLCET